MSSTNNYHFVNDNFEKKLKVFSQILHARKTHLTTLSQPDRNQWAQLTILKCRSLVSIPQHEADLQCNVLILTTLVEQFDCHMLLKTVYANQMRRKMSEEDMVEMFRKYGFNVEDYEILKVEESCFRRYFQWCIG